VEERCIADKVAPVIAMGSRAYRELPQAERLDALRADLPDAVWGVRTRSRH
jgi:hypothetical protein